MKVNTVPWLQYYENTAVLFWLTVHPNLSYNETFNWNIFLICTFFWSGGVSFYVLAVVQYMQSKCNFFESSTSKLTLFSWIELISILEMHIAQNTTTALKQAVWVSEMKNNNWITYMIFEKIYNLAVKSSHKPFSTWNTG